MSTFWSKFLLIFKILYQGTQSIIDFLPKCSIFTWNLSNIIVSTLLSHLQIFEWWYFRKYGTSFIEQVSLNHLSPWLGGAENGGGTSTGQQSPPGKKRKRNISLENVKDKCSWLSLYRVRNYWFCFFKFCFDY